ncbi:uncharacterized protein PFL1_00135 [Pseudozyma flocculosa PF-1]|uniref:uncharacterized protein n=1 Tax=Pseudozyma flocculosa PF-1 TaxID=1277687 RepID=UPI000455FFD6|nr:uncharacterized protein PFL1_00135 [Pseudozyma flocculosa PF-1]EPQ31936.1 hypothetical protein PFL1_00135 [Pseudozyma flocculosa PF-1]
MPHLTRRFTLLRAPDGTLLSPDAMRAHLRAQRARARATGGANAPNGMAAHHFLTEEEENEIIDQLRLQAKAEGRDFEADKFRGPELWSSGYASGTDGFGSWGGSQYSAGSNLQSIADSLGDLTRSTSSKSLDGDVSYNSQLSSPSRRGESGGGLFSGRSSERDMAYFRTLDKERKEHRLEAVSEAADPVEEDDELAQAEGAAKAAGQSEAERPGEGSDELAAAEEQSETEETSSAEAAMPGDFMAAERRASQQKFEGFEPPVALDDVEQGPAAKGSSFLSVPSSTRAEAAALDAAGARQSKLLSSLSPEAFKRVSTALEEVFGIMAAEGSIKSAGSTPVRSHFDLERSSSQQSEPRDDPDAMAATASDAEARSRPQDRDEPDRNRPSVDSDGGSFTSAVSHHGKNASPRDGVRGASLQAPQVEDRPAQSSFAHLEDVHIEGGGLGLGALDLGPTFPLVPASDSNLTIKDNDATGAAPRTSTLTARDRGEDTTPVVTPTDASGAVAEDRLASALPYAAAPFPQSLDSGLTRQADSLYGADPSAGSASTSPAEAPGDSTVIAASAATGIGSAMTSLGDAWSPRSGLHSRKASVASGHSRNDSLGRKDSSRGSSRVLEEQNSLSNVRKHYRQHSRSATASSQDHLGMSPRSSGVVSPVPVLSRTARSPNYFPPPSAGASMQSYAAGFKPASAVSPAAIAAASATSPKARTFGSSGNGSPYNSWAARTRDSASTRESDASPYMLSAPGFSPGLGVGPETSTETGPTSYYHAPAPAGTARASHSRSASNTLESQQVDPSPLLGAATVSAVGESTAAGTLPDPLTRASNSEGGEPAAFQRSRQREVAISVDPTEAWKATYASDLVASAQRAQPTRDDGLEGAIPGADTQVAEDEDLWAQMDQALSSGTGQDARPVSTFPPSAAEDHLANAGVTLDQLATFQDQLVKSAHAGQAPPPPPLPTTPANQTVSAFSAQPGPTSPLSISSSASRGGSIVGASVDSARLERARERARAAADQRSHGYTSSPGHASLYSRIAEQASPRVQLPSFAASPASSSAHGSSRAMKSEVMYDVTTSHRPTSPPPAAARPTSTGLPTLMDLSASFAGQSDRQSLSLVQAVEQAGTYSAMSSTSADQSLWRDRESVHHGSDALDHQSIASGAPIPEAQQDLHVPASEADTSADKSIGYAEAIGFDPAAATNENLDRHPYGHFGNGTHAEASQAGGMPRSTSHNVLQGNSNNLLRSPASPQTAWSDPGENRPDDAYLRPDRTQLIDDVAAQARAATKALKGIDDGSAPTPPFRTKSIARRKSFRKVSKQISSPQLISTTQRMDHVISIPGPERSASSSRTPIWNMMSSNDGGSIPDVPPLPAMGGRPAGAGHRRRSSSFGNSAHGEGGEWAQQQQQQQRSATGHPAPPDVTFMGASPTASPRPESAGQRHGQSLSASRSTSNNSAGGGLSRFMSKIRSRKTSEVAATIEPFPTSPSNSSFGHSKSTTALPIVSPQTQPNRSPTSWKSPEPRHDSLRSPSLRSKQSFLSPTSPNQPLPRIDSTSMPNRSGKKYRTPIVLKPESEVFMAGESEPIRSAAASEQTFGNSPSGGNTGPPTEAEPTAEAPREGVPGDRQPQGMPESLSASSMPIQDRWEADAVAAAAFADKQASSDERGSEEPAHAPPVAVAQPVLEPAPRLEIASPVPVEPSSTDSSAARTSPRPNADSRRKADQRKSLRDTIVRRTIIIPTDFNFEDRRKSTMSTASRRKSKKPAPFLPDEMPWNTAMTPSSSSLGLARADESMASKDSGTSFGTAVPQPSSVGRTSTPPVNASNGASGTSGDLPTLPSSTSVGMATLNSQQSLMPASASAGFGKATQRQSQFNSSYAGSLYDMYIGGDDGSEGNALSEDGRSRSSRMLLGGPGDRTSRMPEPRRHIEVTERADGSVVWQVVAGLADRGSVYSDYESRHSRSSSNGFLPRDRDSLLMPDFNNRDSMISENYDEFEASRTPAGLTNEDSRSFFARPRGHRKSFSFDAAEAPPMPNLPPTLRPPSTYANGGGVDGGAGSTTVDSAMSSSRDTARSGSQAVFEMATSPSQLDDRDEAISPTRIVYHNDAQLASLLDLLARGKDSAKFEFQAMDHAGGGGGGGGASRPASTWTKGEGIEALDAADLESHRSRVEAEIYTLLNQQAAGASQR